MTSCLRGRERRAYIERGLGVWADDPELDFRDFCRRFNRVSSAAWSQEIRARGMVVDRRDNWTKTNREAKTPERMPRRLV